jgi:chemotaxis signal transduction protein
MDRGRRGGLLLRVDGALSFVPSSVALHVAPSPRVTPMPGAPPELLGIAFHAGVIVPVLAIGAARGEMIVCQHGGELVGIVGAEIVKTGWFDVAAERPDAVEYAGETALPLDLPAICARVQAR